MITTSPTHAQSAPDQQVYFDDQLIVKYKEGYSPAEIDARVALRTERADSVTGRLQNTQEDVAAFVAGEPTPEDVQLSIAAVTNVYQAIPDTSAGDAQTYLYTLTSQADITAAVESFEALPVEYVQPNYKYYLHAIPNDVDYQKQWGLQAVKAPQAWDINQGSETVRIAIVDSGIDRNHPDLQQHVVKSEAIMPGCVTDVDSNGHGTHVAGVIGAVAQNAQGIAGINWKVQLLGYCVVSPEGVGSSYALALGIRKAADEGAKVINLSLGGPAFPNADFELIQALSYAASKDVVIVAAAGNCGRFPPGEYITPSMAQCYWGSNADKYLPAADPNTISVAATGPLNEHASFSNSGPSVDIAAPGGNPTSGSASCSSGGQNCIYSTFARSKSCPSSGSPQGYCPLAGTSMSAPFVSGIAGLVRAADPQLNRVAVQSILQNSAIDLGQPGKDPQFGYGLANAFEALKQAGGSSSITQQPTTAPPSPFPSTMPCEQQRSSGDFNCDSTVSLSDFETWRREFEQGLSKLIGFEIFRSHFTGQ